jgi:hypothetical protein
LHRGLYQDLRGASLEGVNISSRWRAWLRVGPAAAYLGVGVGTLNKLRISGAGPPYAKLGHVVVYHPDDLDAWACERKVRSTSERVRAD